MIVLHACIIWLQHAAMPKLAVAKVLQLCCMWCCKHVQFQTYMYTYLHGEQRQAKDITPALNRVFDYEDFRHTGNLVPRGNLRKAALRKAFAFTSLQEFQAPRYFTRLALRTSIVTLLRNRGLDLPKLPGLEQKTWLETQTARLQLLCRRAKKNAHARKHVRKRPQKSRKLSVCLPRPMADDADTQPGWWEAYAWSDEAAASCQHDEGFREQTCASHPCK
jgi:hypothetical protein